jgi:NAD-dependent SIR2 family protein deacetylase
MKNIVYFLGAGFSKNFGYPLTGEIMPEIIALLKKGDLFELGKTKTQKEALLEKQLLHFIYLLYPGLKYVNPERVIAIPSVTEVLSFVDHSCFYNIPPHPELDADNLKQFQMLLNRAIGELLLRYDYMNYTPTERQLLDEFIEPLKQIKKNNNVSFITTNYDLIIDNEFIDQGITNEINYGIPYRDVASSEIVLQKDNPRFNYFKLHGSLNWTRCEFCGHYYINPLGSILFQAFKQKIDRDNTCTCNSSIRLKSVLIAPSLVRDIRDANLLQIWRSALEAIRTADKLIFIGYSLPGEDFAIKSIIMRGINGREASKPPAIDVVQLGDNAYPNFFNLLGKNITYYNQGLAAYLRTNKLP